MAEMDKCACGKWKTEGKPRCGKCAAVARNSGRDKEEIKAHLARANQMRPARCSFAKHPGHLYTKCDEMRRQGIRRRAIAELLGITLKDVHSILWTVDARRRREAGHGA